VFEHETFFLHAGEFSIHVDNMCSLGDGKNVGNFAFSYMYHFGGELFHEML
jgi:hypothetical protein